MRDKYTKFKNRFTKVETIKESSHLDYYLVKENKTGDLYLYEWYEYVDFSHGNDEIYETYSRVKDLEDAIALIKTGSAIRSPYFRINNDYSIREG